MLEDLPNRFFASFSPPPSHPPHAPLPSHTPAAVITNLIHFTVTVIIIIFIVNELISAILVTESTVGSESHRHRHHHQPCCHSADRRPHDLQRRRQGYGLVEGLHSVLKRCETGGVLRTSTNCVANIHAKETLTK